MVQEDGARNGVNMPLFLLWSSNVAGAFCGTFVGSPGAELVNHTSQVVIARQGDKTTLTLVADYQGALSDFALLIPVPESLEAERVTALDASIVDRLDRYSTPRLVQYQCTDAVTFASPGCAAGGCSAADSYGSEGLVVSDAEVEFGTATPTVTVEAQFQLAEYDVALLSAEGADGLYAWLDDNGYEVPPGGEEVVQEYIDAGSHFLAAKVHLDAVPEASTRLSPLQLRYKSEAWTLPLRIGTISASGEQEVVIYALTELLDGDVAIQNYPEGIVEDECMLAPGVEDDFGGYYHDELRGTHPSEDEPAWNTEYNWTLYSLTQDTGYHCDPCTVEREELYDAGELEALGFNDPTDGMTTAGYYGYYGSGMTGNGALLTRIRMVYDPEDIHEDLVLYTKGTHNENRQIRYIRYDQGLEFLYPICGVGYVEDPGMCGAEGAPLSRGSGRSSVPALLVLVGAACIGVVTRRRNA
jgi:hypothetical protein